MRTLSLLLFVCALLNAQNASIDGTTVHSVTGQPLAGVHVTVFTIQANTGPTTAYGAISDKSGRFSIPSLPGGTYFYTGERTGFLSTLKVPSSIPFPTLLLKAGEHVSDLKVDMTPLSVIAGRVLDEHGQPAVNLRVEVDSALPGHAMSTVPRSSWPSTDDRGEFRYIVGPGKYKVKVSGGQMNSGPPEIRDGVLQIEYPIVYYPGVSDAERASVVEVGPGDMATGLEIHLSRQRGMTLSGVISGIPPKAQYTTVSMRFGPEPNTYGGMKSTQVSADGKFTFSGLTPSFYSISAYSRAEDVEMASLTISRHLDGDATIDLALSAGFELSGKVVAPSGFPTASMKLQLIGIMQFGSTTETAIVDVDKDGIFHLKRVFPNKYKVKLMPLPDNAYVSTGEELDLSGGNLSSQSRITVSTDGGTLTGHVLDKDGERITGAVGAVFLFRNKDEANNDRNTVQIKSDGTYSFKGIAPGKYLLFGFDYARFGMEGSMPSIVKLAVKSAIEVEIKPNANLTMDVRAAVKEPR